LDREKSKMKELAQREAKLRTELAEVKNKFKVDTEYLKQHVTIVF
jgi:hypothetical protein